MKGNYLIFKIIKKRNLLQWKRLNIKKLVTFQSCLDLIECSVSHPPHPWHPRVVKQWLLNGLAELSFPLSLTPFFDTELPSTHPPSGLVLGYLLAPSTKQDDHPPTPPPAYFVFQLPCLPVIPIHKVLNWLLLIIYYH